MQPDVEHLTGVQCGSGGVMGLQVWVCRRGRAGHMNAYSCISSSQMYNSTQQYMLSVEHVEHLRGLESRHTCIIRSNCSQRAVSDSSLDHVICSLLSFTWKVSCLILFGHAPAASDALA
jgi:hypothetical protein